MILENIGRSLVLPGGSLDASGAYVAPLQGAGGGLVVGANTANQVLSTTLAGSFGFITDLYIVVTATAAVSSTIALLDASSGAVLWGFAFPAAGPAVGTVLNIRFSNPPRTAAAGGAFYISTTGAGITYMASCNGYFTKSLGN